MKNSNPKTFSSLEEARTYYASLSRKLQAKKEDALLKLAKINAEMENLEKNFREYCLALPLCDQKRYYISILIDMERTSKKGVPENANYTVADIDELIAMWDKDAARPISSISAVPSRPAAENSISSVKNSRLSQLLLQTLRANSRLLRLLPTLPTKKRRPGMTRKSSLISGIHNGYRANDDKFKKGDKNVSFKK